MVDKTRRSWEELSQRSQSDVNFFEALNYRYIFSMICCDWLMTRVGILFSFSFSSYLERFGITSISSYAATKASRADYASIADLDHGSSKLSARLQKTVRAHHRQRQPLNFNSCRSRVSSTRRLPRYSTPPLASSSVTPNLLRL